MWGEASVKMIFLIFWLVCLEVAVPLRVMRPTRFDARLRGWVDVFMHVSRCVLPFQKTFEECRDAQG